jgi:hypothetical protein
MVCSFLTVDRDRFTDQFNGQIMASNLVGNHSEQVQTIGMAGINR